MSDDNSHTPAVPDRREALRQKAHRVRTKQSRHRVLRGTLLSIGAVIAVAAVAVGVTAAVGSAMNRPQLAPSGENGDGFPVTNAADVASITGTESLDAAATPDATPTEAAEDVSEASPSPSATEAPAVDIRVYVDYLSPGAREWQVANAPQLSTWVSTGAADLTYYPVSMLAAKSNGTKYSLRAAGAAACVASYSPDTFFTFNNELLVRQPTAEEDGFSDVELADIAQATGVTDLAKVRGCIEDKAFVSWVQDATERAVEGIPDTDDLSLTGTPTVLVNGRAYVGALDDPDEFAQFVLTSASDDYYRDQETPTPSATPTEAEEDSSDSQE